jgi:hypothetical protein
MLSRVFVLENSLGIQIRPRHFAAQAACGIHDR